MAMELEIVEVEVKCSLPLDEEIKYLRKELYKYRLWIWWGILWGTYLVYAGLHESKPWIMYSQFGFTCLHFANSLLFYGSRRRRFYEWRLKEIETPCREKEKTPEG